MIKLDNPVLETSIKRIMEKLERQGILFNENILIEIGIFYICDLILIGNDTEKLQTLEQNYNSFMGCYNE